MYTTAISPSVATIDAWLALTDLNKPKDAVFATEYTHFGVDIRTKAGSWRNITTRQSTLAVNAYGEEEPGYWTIRGEGSSNGCRETFILAKNVVAARGHIID